MRILVGQWGAGREGRIKALALVEGWKRALKVARSIRANGGRPAFGTGIFVFKDKRGHRK